MLMTNKNWATVLLATTALVGGLGIDASAASAQGEFARATPHAASSASGPTLPGTHCPALPADNVWNTPITGLPVNVNSATWTSSMDASTTDLHPDYGPSGNPKRPYGIPWVIVPARTKFTSIKFLYASESDRRPYPLTASTPIEGGSDRHALMVDPAKSASSPPAGPPWRRRPPPRPPPEARPPTRRAGRRAPPGSRAIWNQNQAPLPPA